jgi:hypothetical protein
MKSIWTYNLIGKVVPHISFPDSAPLGRFVDSKSEGIDWAGLSGGGTTHQLGKVTLEECNLVLSVLTGCVCVLS